VTNPLNVVYLHFQWDGALEPDPRPVALEPG
jgi:hypothetical protein